jgi:hypothetical protein
VDARIVIPWAGLTILTGFVQTHVSSMLLCRGSFGRKYWRSLLPLLPGCLS